MTMRNAVNELQAIRRRVIDHVSQKISKGRHFFTKGITSLDGARSTGLFMFVTPLNTWEIHAKAIISAEDEFTLEIWEGSTILNSGSEIQTFNNNRNSPNTPHLTAYVNPVISGAASGTLIWSAKTASNKVAAAVTPAMGYEIIAKSGCAYVWKITKEAAGAHWLDYDFFWHEERTIPQ